MQLDKRTFCQGIRAIRKAEGLTLKQLSDRSDINPGMISQIEHGRFPATINTIMRLQDGLELSNERMLTLMGFKNKTYRKVPVIPVHVKNFGEAIASAKTLSFIADYTPKHCFIVKVSGEMSPLVHKGSYVLINRDFDYINGKIYAIKLGDNILIGRVYKSKGHSYGVLVTNKDSYFNVDYKGRFKVLGQVVRIINNI